MIEAIEQLRNALDRPIFDERIIFACPISGVGVVTGLTVHRDIPILFNLTAEAIHHGTLFVRRAAREVLEGGLPHYSGYAGQIGHKIGLLLEGHAIGHGGNKY